MSSYSRSQLEAWLKTIEVRGKVLDIGGSQLPMKGRTKTWGATLYDILDLPEPHEVEQRPGIIADIQDIKDTNVADWFKIHGPYNIIFCIEVAEYWYDPLEALRNINCLLTKGGTLYISFHFLYPIHNPEDQDYLRYTRSGARRLLKEAGFDIEEIRPKTFENPHYPKMLYDNERMKGVGKNSGEIHREQGWLISAVKIGD